MFNHRCQQLYFFPNGYDHRTDSTRCCFLSNQCQMQWSCNRIGNGCHKRRYRILYLFLDSLGGKWSYCFGTYSRNLYLQHQRCKQLCSICHLYPYSTECFADYYFWSNQYNLLRNFHRISHRKCNRGNRGIYVFLVAGRRQRYGSSEPACRNLYLFCDRLQRMYLFIGCCQPHSTGRINRLHTKYTGFLRKQ